ncbi:Helix-turn-helix domain protein [Posidoniimonas corsicana]|uniref:Helix-turn-helix domain protein n=1 Tax=Posidoniimonas corsicana TaxID=1938618 RepID=A0A5C5VG82_9BACT|nr:helix-turn-helix domain-containing protein [Posidoniimonas corsicana]TWT37654.1 Helix-turn-helix domain protein [Posidoniimonas corsicana]
MRQLAIKTKEVTRCDQPVDPVVGINAACRELGLSERTIRRHVAEGRIRHARVGGSIRIRASELERIKDEGLRVVE